MIVTVLLGSGDSSCIVGGGEVVIVLYCSGEVVTVTVLFRGCGGSPCIYFNGVVD